MKIIQSVALISVTMMELHNTHANAIFHSCIGSTVNAIICHGQLSSVPRGGDSEPLSESASIERETQEPIITESEQLLQSSSETMTHTNTNPNMQQFQYHRHMTRSDERAILGRAVLTTPHRRMPAIRIAAGPRPPFTSPTNPGPVVQATPIFVTKFSLCESLGCALRDLRVVDQFSANGRYSGPAFLARSNCVIVNVGHVRAIVMRNQVLIFLPEVTNNGNTRRNNSHELLNINIEETRGNANGASGKGTKMMETIECLVEALVTHLNSIYHSSHHLMFDEEGRGQGTQMKLASRDDTTMGQQWGSGWYSSGRTNSELLPSASMVQNTNTKNRMDKKGKFLQKKIKEAPPSMPAPTAPAPPFELVVIEALLGHVCSFESLKVAQLIQTAEDVLEGISEGGRKKDAFIGMQTKLGELLPLKNKVDELEAKCAEVAGAIAEGEYDVPCTVVLLNK